MAGNEKSRGRELLQDGDRILQVDTKRVIWGKIVIQILADEGNMLDIGALAS